MSADELGRCRNGSVTLANIQLNHSYLSNHDYSYLLTISGVCGGAGGEGLAPQTLEHLHCKNVC